MSCLRLGEWSVCVLLLSACSYEPVNVDSAAQHMVAYDGGPDSGPDIGALRMRCLQLEDAHYEECLNGWGSWWRSLFSDLDNCVAEFNAEHPECVFLGVNTAEGAREIHNEYGWYNEIVGGGLGILANVPWDLGHCVVGAGEMYYTWGETASIIVFGEGYEYSVSNEELWAASVACMKTAAAALMMRFPLAGLAAILSRLGFLGYSCFDACLSNNMNTPEGQEACTRACYEGLGAESMALLIVFGTARAVRTSPGNALVDPNAPPQWQPGDVLEVQLPNGTWRPIARMGANGQWVPYQLPIVTTVNPPGLPAPGSPPGLPAPVPPPGLPAPISTPGLPVPVTPQVPVVSAVPPTPLPPVPIDFSVPVAPTYTAGELRCYREQVPTVEREFFMEEIRTLNGKIDVVETELIARRAELHEIDHPLISQEETLNRFTGQILDGLRGLPEPEPEPEQTLDELIAESAADNSITKEEAKAILQRRIDDLVAKWEDLVARREVQRNSLQHWMNRIMDALRQQNGTTSCPFESSGIIDGGYDSYAVYDAGVPSYDGGTPTSDAGTPSDYAIYDAGAPSYDAGTNYDYGSSHDAGTHDYTDGGYI